MIIDLDWGSDGNKLINSNEREFSIIEKQNFDVIY